MKLFFRVFKKLLITIKSGKLPHNDPAVSVPSYTRKSRFGPEAGLGVKVRGVTILVAVTRTDTFTPRESPGEECYAVTRLVTKQAVMKIAQRGGDKISVSCGRLKPYALKKPSERKKRQRCTEEQNAVIG
jgi:hypothetical protein